jgi:ATP-dependent Lon protease
MEMKVPILIITGPPGVGKTAVASEVSELLEQALDIGRSETMGAE